MQDEELAEIVENLRTLGCDVADVEVKRAEGGLPKSVRKTLSAFANTQGGTLVLGLDEASGFSATGLTKPAQMADNLAALCSTDMEPPLRPFIRVHDFEGVKVLVAEIPELERAAKPCFYRGGGLTQGSYVRVGDGDRRLSSYEVQLMLSNRGQPDHDKEPVPGTSIADLQPELLAAFLERMRATRPHVFGALDDVGVLRRMRVLVPHGEVEALSLAGYLSLVEYPQQLFPRLSLSFVHYPTEGGADPTTGMRYLDSVSVEGAIPVMVQEALAALRRNMKRRAVVSGSGRREIWEYPEIALREAIANAFVHRDLSPDSRGSQVQVEMYPDRLVVRNPGGLFGPVTLNELGREGTSSTRNATLARLLREVVVPESGRPVCETVGSGIRAMIDALRATRMSPPLFVDKIAVFRVTFPNHSLLSEDMLAWLAGLGETGLSGNQCVALALLREGEVLDNGRYRTMTGLDSRVATAELQNLVARELVVQSGTHRWTRYRLAPEPKLGVQKRVRLRADRRVELLSALGDEVLSRSQLVERTGLSDPTVRRWLSVLHKDGTVEIVGEASKSRNVRYRRTGQVSLDGL